MFQSRFALATFVAIVALHLWASPSLFAVEDAKSRLEDTSAPRQDWLKQTIQAMWKDAAIDTDAQFRKLTNAPVKQAVWPNDMRRLIKQWNARTGQRRWPSAPTMRCEDGHAVCTWQATIINTFDTTAANLHAIKILEQLGYRRVAKDARKAVATRLALSPDDRRIGNAARYHWFVRQVEQTELVVIFTSCINDDSTAFTFKSGLEIEWSVSRACSPVQPTLSQVLDAVPNSKVPYLDGAFYQGLKDERVIAIRTDRGITIEFRHDARQKIIKQLERIKFKYQGQRDPLPSGSVQQTWHRYMDETFAHLIENQAKEPKSAKSNHAPSQQRVLFICQTPQHKGKPKTKAPLDRHPSLLLPRSKRPIVALEKLAFKDPVIQAQTQAVEKIAEELASKDWTIQRYKDIRYSNAPLFTGEWASAKVRSLYVPMKFVPYRSIAITLKGSAVKLGQPEKLETVEFDGRYIPKTGWGALVQCETIPGGESTLAPVLVMVGKVDPHSSSFRYERTFGNSAFYILGARISVHVQHGRYLKYQFRSNVVQSEPDQPLHAVRLCRLQAIHKSPEALRDIMLSDIETLNQQCRREISKQKNISVKDSTNARSDNPPRTTGVVSIDPKIQVQLIQEVAKELAIRKKLVDEDYKSIHQAIVKALPIKDLLDQQ